ncbi:growth hormone receptor a [Chanos chanos]|uniref:Growth hormone receptor n=1 Tax=Chanos chanos TaxID=29144 RepID=A0A6J2W2M5_CHACN|nr:growth hormone receptor [Chanos chanos]
MAVTLSLFLLSLVLLYGTRAESTPAAVTVSPGSIEGPHFTGCRSREQETFRCWWTAGSFRNLSEPGALRVFFLTKNSNSEWQECPDYTAGVENECYFNKTFTFIWTSYCVQLRDAFQNTTYDDYCFTVENIVRPDPPIGLNWTLLNVSRSGLHFDILVRWAPPPSADVEMGWMSLVYQVQYRVRNASFWEELGLESGTQQSIYGLHTDKEYEVRVRCKMSAFKDFGEFSNTILVHVEQIPSKESTFPMTLILIFGVVGVVILLMLIIFSQQQRLMVILLPPVPAPKIKGIDPDLLKKGKLDQLNSILSSQHMYKPDVYREDPWVEFIELDVDEPPCEKDHGSDTQRLLGRDHMGSSHALGAKDDDSGRASCYDPDVAEPDSMLMTALLSSGNSETSGERHPLVSRSSSAHSLSDPVDSAEMRSPIQTQPSMPSWINMDFYAQVSDVTPSGGVVLSPGQQNSSQENNPEKKKGEGEDQEQDGEEKKLMKVQLLVVDPDSAYTSESSARQLSSNAASGPPEQTYQALSSQPTEEVSGRERVEGGYISTPASPGEYQSPYLFPDAPQPPLSLPPVSDYTVVQDVDAQHSLLLNPSNAQPSPCPLNPTKHLPAMPTMGYLTPDLLGNLSP